MNLTLAFPRVDYDEGYRRNIIDEPLESTVLESLRLAAFPAISPLFFFVLPAFASFFGFEQDQKASTIKVGLAWLHS